MTITESKRTEPVVDWHQPPAFLLRVGGLPFDAAVSLRSPRACAWAEEILDAERDLRLRAERISDTLGHAVARHRENQALRRDLVNIRRDVFNLRVPDATARDRVAATLDPPTRQEIDAWCAARNRYAALQEAGAALAGAEVAEGREVLRALAVDPTLRAGILLSSPSLDRYLPTYLNATPGPLGKRARRIERSLLEYLYRASAKTSPFSTLTTVTLGRIEPGAGQALRLDLGGGNQRSKVRLNIGILSQLSTLLLADQAMSADLPVLATAGWEVSGERIRYLRRRALAGRNDDEDAPMAMDTVRESLFYLPSGQLLAEVLDLVGDGPPRRLGEVADRVATGPERPRDEVERFLRHLIRVGLLVVPNLQIDIHDPDPFASYRAGMAALDRPWASELAERLDGVAATIRSYPSRGLAGRRAALDEIRDGLQDAQQRIAPAPPQVPRTLVYEDATLDRGQAVADRDVWRDRLQPDLEDLAQVFPLFNMMLPRRLVTKGFFRARYGTGARHDDFLTFAHEFQRDFFDSYSKGLMRWRGPAGSDRLRRQRNPLRMPEIDALDDAKRYLAEGVSDLHAALPPGAEELELPAGLLREAGARTPATPSLLEPWSFFLQLADRGPGEVPLAVLNRVYSGLTLLFSRFTHLFTDGSLDSTLRRTLLELQPKGAVFAELQGGYAASNLNLHSAVLPYELVCPGDRSRRDPEAQIPMEDLFLVDDREQDRLVLRSKRLGVEVIPVYLGFLMPMALPEVQQVLLNLSYTGMAMLDLWIGTQVPVPDRTIAGYPRIRYGNVVVQRRMWKMHPSYLPLREPRQPDHEWFLAWRRWQRDNGVPSRVFVNPYGGMPTSDAADADVDAGQPATRRRFGDYKPLYTDFESHFSLSLLDSVIRQADQRLIMTEMLPDENQLVARDGAARYVSELTMELAGVRRNR
ncbi:lantibiotic dehydratase [Acrocarpospora macrocephala]|uniref:Lanthionine biosynthesis protein n=1 Tax=Acrocarpospora macrocephala TaxID=150177 RepID=A0A5M3WTH2_9ACTN|nr:lantibiotic dehydratase [Acrocarpospora macrocephala]GES11970.1 lanthionine biosynthesis protein [Acrocarpospora macrocephala]